MAKTRKKYSAEFKLKVVLEILKGEKTAGELAGKFEVYNAPQNSDRCA